MTRSSVLQSNLVVCHIVQKRCGQNAANICQVVTLQIYMLSLYFALKFYFIHFNLQWPWMSVEHHEGFVWMQCCFFKWNCHLHFSHCAVFLATWTYIAYIVVTAAPWQVQSIAISMSVCLICPLTYIKTSQNFPYVLPVAVALTTVQYVVYFQFCGRRHFFHIIGHTCMWCTVRVLAEGRQSVGDNTQKEWSFSAWASVLPRTV